MTSPSRIHLFQGYGVELEYMLVDRETLKVKPISDLLLKAVLGDYGSDFENGRVTWSNELVMHVIELKSTHPDKDFESLEESFVANIKKINDLLRDFNAILLPTAAHPFMDPIAETKIWPHDNSEVYETYNQIFDCRGHGWANLQSTHLNLPFYDDEEFAKLHAAVRLILPLLPALCASSPILDGQTSGTLDVRLHYYKSNQARIPSITGRVIPEAIFSRRSYFNTIYEKIKSDIRPFDKKDILNPIWVNSRGAIPRFDRGSIEIRIMDVQECPKADLAIIQLVVEVLKKLVSGTWISLEDQMEWDTRLLAQIYEQVIITGLNTKIQNTDYLKALGLNEHQASVKEVWHKLLEQAGESFPGKESILFILQNGSLSERILTSLGEEIKMNNLISVYKELALSLANNEMFLSK